VLGEELGRGVQGTNGHAGPVHAAVRPVNGANPAEAPATGESDPRAGGGSPRTNVAGIHEFGSLAQRYHKVLRALRTSQRAEERYRRRHEQLAGEVRRATRLAVEWRARYAELENSMPIRIVQHLAPTGSTRRRILRYAGRPVKRRHPPAGRDLRPSIPVIPMALEPEVSIVIPVHDHWMLTASCLCSIAEDVAAVGYEVIVVDDASTDESSVALDEIVGINLVRLTENSGFLGAVNAGLERARGRYVVLLNNDTLVRPGWLDALVRTAEADESIGVVGAKLVYPDGRLQEAGGIIFRDGSGHNFGRGEDPEDPRFNFVREVDYCSGACLLVRRDLLRTLGGLDVRFGPAYYEDTDLCFAARKHGYRVVYQPRAVVCHLEGASHGTDVSTGVKQYQEVNRKTFTDKWRQELLTQAEPGTTPVRLAAWRTDYGRVVVVDHQIPMPDHDSGSRRMSELLTVLTELGFGVTFVPQNGITIAEYRDRLQERGIEVLGGPGDLDRYLQDLGHHVRLGILSRPTVAWEILPMFRSLTPSARLVYDTVDLHYIRESRRAGVEDDPDANRSAQFHHDMELALTRLCDETWVVTEKERAILLEEDPHLRVSVVPNIHQEEPSGPSFEHREGLLFVGSYPHTPNRDAATWLATEILPMVHEKIPEVPLYLAGSHPDDEIRNLESEHVRVLGWVPDLEDLYHHSRVFVAPLRFGAGMKGKVGESLSYGLPVVTTSLGAEGMSLAEGREVLLGDDAQSLVDAIVQAYTDRDLWESLAANGQQAIDRQFSPLMVRARLRRLLWELGLFVPTPGRASEAATPT